MAILNGLLHRLSSIADSEFAEYAPQVKPNRDILNAQPAGNLLVAQSVGQLDQHIELSWGQWLAVREKGRSRVAIIPAVGANRRGRDKGLPCGDEFQQRRQRFAAATQGHDADPVPH